MITIKKTIKMKFAQKIFYLSALCFLMLLSACGTGNEDDDSHFYRFTHENNDIEYSFVVKTSNREVIAKIEQELQKPFDERRMHINGPIERGEKDYNDNWSWHFVENQWALAEISTEVCDGRPSFVEEDIDYWVDQVGRFCPWSSRVEAEINF